MRCTAEMSPDPHEVPALTGCARQSGPGRELAREMQFGRPDVPRDDDGGMIDVSHAPAVLASSLGLTSQEQRLPTRHVNSLAGSAAQTSWHRMHNFNRIVWTPYSMRCCSPERRYRERTTGHPVRTVK